MKVLRQAEWEWLPVKPQDAFEARLGEEICWIVPNWDDQQQTIIDLNHRIRGEREKLETLRREMQLEDEEAAVKHHIKQLHRYNEMKDLAQSMLGRLAMVEGVTVKELYPKFDLELND